MRFSIQLFVAAVFASTITQSRADYIYCVSAIYADKTNVCVNEPVNISIDSSTCSNGRTAWAGTNYSRIFTNTGVNVISNWCSACGEGSSVAFVTITVGQLAGISPASPTMCPGTYMVFTANSTSNAISCGPIWGFSPANAGTLSSVGNTATFSLFAAYNNGTAILTASCGSVTSTATITVATSGLLTIATQPVSRVTCPGSNVTFSVAATGSGPLFYQWRWNGVILTNFAKFSGVTNSTLTISNVFANMTASSSIPAIKGSGVVFMLDSGLYTYQASGCAGVTPPFSVDPEGDTYTNGNCTALFAGPTPDWAGCDCPGRAAYSLVDVNACQQFGTNGQFQTPGEVLRLVLNDNSRGYNTGSWEATFTHTVEGTYDCIVSNSCGAQISTGATLYVSTPCDGIPDWWRLEQFGRTNVDNYYTCALCISTNPWAHGLTNLRLYQNPSVLISNNYSTVGDGIPDWWKVTYGFSLTDTNAAGADPDNDCWTNLEEYRNGTNPHNSNPSWSMPYTANYRTNALCHTVNWNGDFVVGSNTFADVLLIQNGSVLSDTGDGYLGYEANSSNNTVIVTGPGSVWSNNYLYIGYAGSGNCLIISNGGQVVEDPSYGNCLVGYCPSGQCNNNTVIVTGAGSVWKTAVLQLYNSEGSLVINKGGQVVVNNVFLASSSNDSVLVTDTGSVWSNGYINMGGVGPESLVVSNGGQVVSTYTDFGGDGNSLVITGPGSVCNTVQLDIEGQSALLVTDGGLLLASDYLDVDCGNRYDGMVISSGGQVISGTGSLDSQDESGNMHVLVTDPGSAWYSHDLNIGGTGDDNGMIVSNGGKVVDVNGSVSADGEDAPDHLENNFALVTGAGSTWSNANLAVGLWDDGTLIISNGTVAASSNLFIGHGIGGILNSAVILNGGTLTVANPAGSALLEISGGTLTINDGTCAPNFLFMPNGQASTLVCNGGTITTHIAEILNDSVVQFALGTNSHPIHVTGNLTLKATIVLTNQEGFIPTNQTLFTYGGTLTDNGVTVVTAFNPPSTCGNLPSMGAPVTNASYTIDTSVAGQVNLVATLVELTRTAEGAVSLRWNSQSNAIYRIECTDDSSTDTVWQVLYDYYPSHGTSTFWTDTGSYLVKPVVNPPSQVTNRCYRVTKMATNSSPPQVSISWPQSGAVLATNVTVTISANGATAIAITKLFVDGDEVAQGNGQTTNFIINTCEWSNGPHTLFAVAEDSTGVDTTPSTAPLVTNTVLPGVTASAFISVVFSNYVSRWSFSEPFFEPDLGETQNISAAFTTNSNWTLTIRDSSGVTRRSVTGTGATMSFAWDGTGTGGANLPNGLYGFSLSAVAVSPASGSGTATSPLTKAKKVRGPVGTFGVAYRTTYSPIGYESFVPPADPLASGGYVYTDAGGHPAFNPLWPAAYADARGFANAMSSAGWRQPLPFPLIDYDFRPEHLRSASYGGSNKFSDVNIGYISMHGVKGLWCDHTISQNDCVYETYLPFPCLCSPPYYDWVRLSECSFGSTNLHWLAIDACNLLSDPGFGDMWDKYLLPINDDLHLLLGAASVSYTGVSLPGTWASDMLGQMPSRPNPNTVMNAWFYAGTATQIAPQARHPEWGMVVFRVAGHAPCFSDTLLDWSYPDPEEYIDWQDQQVAPPQ